MNDPFSKDIFEEVVGAFENAKSEEEKEKEFMTEMKGMANDYK